MIPSAFSRIGGCILGFAFLSSVVSAAEFYDAWAASRFSDAPGLAGPFLDADGDQETNVLEFVLGTDPRVADGISGALTPRLGAAAGSVGEFSIEVLQREGHQPGAQLDLILSDDLAHWFRPWWQRTVTGSQPADPPGSVRELFSTRLAGADPWFVRASATLLRSGPELATYYVATNGNDANPGSLTLPFATLGKAAGLANPGNLIYLRGGTYPWTAKVQLTRSGTVAQPIRVRAYPGETPVLDFSGQTFSSSNRGIEIPGACWQLFGLEIVGAGDNGINITGASNVIEQCVFRECRDSGLQLHSGSSYNQILNCDSYRNFDTGTAGENADGFAAKFGIGPGNVFRACRAWENSDDGWDLWQATNTVVIERCWTWRNGIDFWGLGGAFAGDGNGFKLGGDNYPGVHRISHSIAFANPHHGIDQNNNTLGQIVDHNTVWANGGKNLYLDHGVNTTPHVVRNNLSFAGGVADTIRSGSLLTNNSWQVLLSPPAGTNDLLSLEIALAAAPRRDDGNLPEVPFLRPIPQGRLVDQGVDVGEAFIGTAPDIGAFESPEW